MRHILQKTMRLVTLFICATALICAVPAAEGAKQSKKAKTTATTNKSGKKQQSKTSQKGKSTSGKNSGKKTNRKGSKKNNSKKGKTETSADVKRQQEATSREIKQTREQIQQNEAEVKKNLGELNRLGSDIADSKKKVADAGAKVKSLQNNIDALQTEIGKQEKSLQRMRSEYLKAVKAMRKKRHEKSTIAFIFSANSFNEAFRRMRYLRKFASWRENQSEEIERNVKELKTRTAKLAQTKKQHDLQLAAEVKARDELQTQYNRQDALVTELKKNGAALQSHLERKQQEANTLKGRIAALIAEETRREEARQREREQAEARRRAEAEQRARAEAERKAEEERQALIAQNEAKKETPKATEKPAAKPADKPKAEPKPESKPKAETKPAKKKETKKREEPKPDNGGEVTYAEARRRKPRNAKQPPKSGSNVPEPKKVESATKPAAKPAAGGSSFESMKGALPRPVAGSFRVTSRFGTQSLPDMPNVKYDNPGIDAIVANGATAQAVYAGKVSAIYMVPGYGTVVILSHGNYYTVYGNLQQASVKTGDNVKQGQALGRVAPSDDDPQYSSIHFEVWRNRDKLDPLTWIR